MKNEWNFRYCKMNNRIWTFQLFNFLHKIESFLSIQNVWFDFFIYKLEVSEPKWVNMELSHLGSEASNYIFLSHNWFFCIFKSILLFFQKLYYLWKNWKININKNFLRIQWNPLMKTIWKHSWLSELTL